MPTLSLRARVLAGFALIAVVLGGVSVLITRTTEANLVRQVDAQLASASDSFRDADYDADRDVHDAHGEEVPPGSDPSGPPQLSPLYAGIVVDGEVTALATPNLSGSSTALPRLDAATAEAAAATGQPFTVPSDDDDLRYRVRAFPDRRSGATLVVALPLDSVDDAVADLVTVEALGGVVIIATLALVAWWVIHLGIRPIRSMTEVATDIAAGDLSHRVDDAQPGTEAGDLGVALNQMLSRIESSFDEQRRTDARLRQFVADASHELRTPVATIRGYAELYRTGALDRPQDLDDAMRRTEQEAVRMGGLVEDLLTLARLDQGRPLAAEPVDLAQLVRDAAGDAHAMDSSRPIQADVADHLVVTGDEARLRQVLANVVGNALVHTPPGTPIDLRARRDGATAVVEVVDHGAGMDPDVAARAFERFYRADPARSRHQGGSGLGLAIVETVVQAHGGEAQLRTAPGEGTTVRIQLPLAPPGDPPRDAPGDLPGS